MSLSSHLHFLVILLGISVTSFSETDINLSPHSKYTNESKILNVELQNMDVRDGIDKKEAEIIARAYFHMQVGCGSYEKVSDGVSFWEVHGRIGRGAIPIKGFQIEKNTGKITSPIGPSYANPKVIFEELAGSPVQKHKIAQQGAEPDAGTDRKLAP